MEKVGILYICTGKYSIFWREFLERAEKFFLLDTEKHFFIFTDNDEILDQRNEYIHTYYQELEPWPLPTLMRFKYFLSIEKDLSEMDYLLFMNANLMVQCDIVSGDIFPRGDERLFVTLHPGYYEKVPRQYTYDNNPQSSAYIAHGEGEYYFAGGFNGGKTFDYLRLIKTLDQRIQEDYQKGIVALWHDESHLNRYMYEYKENFRILSPSYLFPENYASEIPFFCKILVLNKQRFGGHEAMRK